MKSQNPELESISCEVGFGKSDGLFILFCPDEEYIKVHKSIQNPKKRRCEDMFFLYRKVARRTTLSLPNAITRSD